MTVAELRAAAITLAEANSYVAAFHRHNGRLPSAKFAIAAVDRAGLVVGVAIAGLPKARLLAQRGTLEVNRVCTQGYENACSFLYGSCKRAAKALGYCRLVTYTTSDEPGASLKASGWTAVTESSGGTWARPNQQRTRKLASDTHDLGAKVRWEIRLCDFDGELVWPDALRDDSQMTLLLTEAI